MGPYRRVASADDDRMGSTSAADGVEGLSSPPNSSASNAIPSQRSRAERLSDKIHALVWMIAAYATAHVTQLPHTLLTSPRIFRPLFHVSLILFAIDAVLLFYLVAYLPRFRNIKSSATWDVYCPRVIPAMTVCGVAGSLAMVRACWGVWGFLSPLVLGTVALGMFFSLHFIPWC